MFAQQLEFDFEFGCIGIEAEYYREGAQDLIQRLVPRDLLEENSMELASQRARFADLLPMISWSDLTRAPCALSVLLLCKYRLNACNFFYDMVSRWLLPQKRVNVELFFASDIRLPHLSEDLLSVAEIVVYLRSAHDVEEVRRNLQAIETEIRLGVVSNYHARRILEFKGLSADGKTAMIQEKIGSLIQSHSKDFDRGIFNQMQQFLVTCPEEFKRARDYHHISRMISNFYSMRKVLKAPNAKQHVQVKFLKTQVQGKAVLGVLMGLNFLGEYEVFESAHLLKAIHQQFPAATLVHGSAFSEREGAVQTIYLEIEKGSDFSLEEVQRLRKALPERAKGHIEQLAHPIFMPRNDEEVLRNIMALSRQLGSIHDMPQVAISFDEQRGEELYFTVVLLRVLVEGAPTVQELFAGAKTDLNYLPDRVRNVGHLRRKHVKEATVFRTFVLSRSFLRPDHSIDLHRARQHIFSELCSIFGEVRDYNGGMIHKHQEQLSALKLALGRLAEVQNLKLEKFFHALMPLEMRTSLDIDAMKQFFLLFLQAMKSDLKGDLLYKQETGRVFVVVPHESKPSDALSLPAHQYATCSFDGYMGYVLLSDDGEVQGRFLKMFELSLMG